MQTVSGKMRAKMRQWGAGGAGGNGGGNVRRGVKNDKNVVFESGLEGEGRGVRNWRGRENRKDRKMKLIIAYIQPERLNAVKQELFAREVFKMSVSNALGCGQQKGYVQMYRGAIEEVSLHKKVRLAIAVNDGFVERTIEGIIAGARTGEIGDGKIFVLPMDECVRIRTGERGEAAIG